MTDRNKSDAKATSSEQEILARYSTPGLRKNELSYVNKKDQLASMGVKGNEADTILRELYLGGTDVVDPPE